MMLLLLLASPTVLLGLKRLSLLIRYTSFSKTGRYLTTAKTVSTLQTTLELTLRAPSR